MYNDEHENELEVSTILCGVLCIYEKMALNQNSTIIE